ncbi:hypothetical protein [Pedobacter panaciterrae]
MLLPGPEAQQLAIYIGWQLHGKKGGLIVKHFICTSLHVYFAITKHTVRFLWKSAMDVCYVQWI